SQGRLAFSGASLRSDSARAAQKPPKPSGVVAISAPPATITSASPYWMLRMARPTLWLAVVQAVTTEKFGPLRPYMIERLPEIMLMMLDGTKNGDTRLGELLFSRMAAWAFSMLVRPPMPEPTATPMRAALASVTWMPESLKAWTEAAMPYCTKGSIFLTSLGGI